MKLSVIIPVYNAGPLLEDTLRSLRAGTRLPDELIVVDDASPDRSVTRARAFGARIVSMSQNVGPAACRNEGVLHSDGDVLVFLDADTCPHPDTLARIEAHFHSDPGLTAVIGGYDDHPRDPGVISRFRNLAHCFVHRTSHRNALTFWSGCGAVRREVFFAAGGFDEWYHRPSVEDIELGYRMSDGGARILLDPLTCVTHTKRWTLWSGIVTDVAYRGMPWTALLLERGKAPDDLNLTFHHRLAALVTAGAIACLVVVFRSPVWLVGSVVCAVVALVCDRRLLAFLARQGGWRLVVVSSGLILLQNVCKLIAALSGTALFLKRRLTGRSARRPWVSRLLAADETLPTTSTGRER